jgi:hypothetical protein
MNQRVDIVVYESRGAKAFDREARKGFAKAVKKGKFEISTLLATSMRGVIDYRSGNRCMDFTSCDSSKSPTPLRRLDDRIRDLCAQALTAEGTDLDAILSTLQLELREHTARIRKLAAQKLVIGLTTRRRKSSSV